MACTPFDRHYAEVWGERWPTLRSAMARPARHVARLNAFASGEAIRQSLIASDLSRNGSAGSGDGEPTMCSGASRVARLRRDFCVSEIPRDADDIALHAQTMGCAVPRCLMIDGTETDGRDGSSNREMPQRGFIRPEDVMEACGLGCAPYYMMDLASVVCAVLLQVRTGDSVADFCSAPGGKALVLAEAACGASFAAADGASPRGRGGKLCANDPSGDRNSRLQGVLDRFIPEGPRAKVSVTRIDATRWHERGAVATFDRVLVDAPCGSERHLLEAGNARSLASWTSGYSVSMATRQKAILSSALKAVKPGGLVVYSTCSISMHENDEVVCRVVGKNGSGCRVVQPGELPGWVQHYLASTLPGAWRERSQYGWWCLPDANEGWGPLYFTLIYREK